jgi:hypothetical protein
MATEDTERIMNESSSRFPSLRSIAALTEHGCLHTLDCAAMRLEA